MPPSYAGSQQASPPDPYEFNLSKERGDAEKSCADDRRETLQSE